MQYPGSVHNHTDYSNLRLRDAISTISGLIDRALELNQEVIAFTEHETVSNAIKIEKYYNKIKKDNPNFKVILGNEIYLCRNGLNAETYKRGEDIFYHFILLAKNKKGHEQIREISTRAWQRSFKTGKMTRVPTWYSDLQEVIGKEPGNVIMSTACLGGFLPKKIMEYYNKGLGEDFYQAILNWCRKMESICGKGNFYLELQPSDTKEQVLVNKELVKISKLLGIPYIITTDSHYICKEDRPIHKAYLNAQEGDREVDDFYSTTYLQSTEEVESYIDYLSREELDSAYQSILNIKNSCEDYSLMRELKIPSLAWKEPAVKEIKQEYFDAIPNLEKFYNSKFKGDKILAQMIVSKLEAVPALRTDKIYAEINQNLDATWVSSEVNKTHWSAYFLNLQKIIDVCWDSGTIVGPGRGSGVGFILLYILDIIQINPAWETTKCFSWRFLNPDRVSVLDIDTDIEGGRRAQVLQGLRKFYGEDRVANVVTFGTEKSKAALQTAARGLNIDNDEALYLSSLIPADRGQTRTLKECFYGDEEKGFKPIPEFVKAMSEDYPELWKVASSIEGLVCRVGEHAGGVIFVDEPFTKSTALMKVPNGDTVTQFDLHDSEDCSLIKMDLLSVECLDKIHTCLDLLTEDGYLDKNLPLRDRYEQAIGIYNLERNNQDMWKMVWNHEIQSLFQMEKQSGIQGIEAIKPKSVDELAVLNSVIRLMAPDEHSERPLETWVKYRKNINLWYDEMRRHGLTEEEVQWLGQHSAITDGICESQEGLMSLVQEQRLGGNSLGFADKCRKGIAKKQGNLFQECEDIYYTNIKEQGLSENLAHYVWDVLLRVQRGYSFNRSHCLAYSLVALQEMNLCFKYPMIYWNCACLITDSGAEGANTNYDKIARAIGKITKAGVKINLPDVNKSSYGFLPDAKHNVIWCGFKSMLNVGDEVIENTIKYRPYSSIDDYLEKVHPNKQAMISLLKGGAFDSMGDRQQLMAYYIWKVCDKKKRLTLQNLPGLISHGMLPQDTEEQITARRVYEFNRYLKQICINSTKDFYNLNDRAINFLNEMDLSHMIEPDLTMSVKAWDKYYQKWMDVFRAWINSDKEHLLDELNYEIFKADWNKYAEGTLSDWEMEVLCFYYHEHALAKLDQDKYGYSDFFEIPREPVIVDSWTTRNGHEIKKYQLYRIAGTCIAKDKLHSSISLLTTTGVVDVKFSREHFALYDKQISQRGADGVKHKIEGSWFARGEKLVIQGIRRDDTFLPKKYKDSSMEHRLYHIDKIENNGKDLVLRSNRAQGEYYEDDSIR